VCGRHEVPGRQDARVTEKLSAGRGHLKTAPVVKVATKVARLPKGAPGDGRRKSLIINN
jgi:hypothetical protein